MDRKQREDAINEVSQGSLKLAGPCTQGHAAPLYHYLQGELHGQEVSLYRYGLR